MSGYREVKVKVESKKNEDAEINLNIDSIQYYRSFIDKDRNGNPILDTQVYLQANPKGIRLKCNPDWLTRQLKRNIDLSHLTNENFEKAMAYIKALQPE